MNKYSIITAASSGNHSETDRAYDIYEQLEEDILARLREADCMSEESADDGHHCNSDESGQDTSFD